MRSEKYRTLANIDYGEPFQYDSDELDYTDGSDLVSQSARVAEFLQMDQPGDAAPVQTEPAAVPEHSATQQIPAVQPAVANTPAAPAAETAAVTAAPEKARRRGRKGKAGKEADPKSEFLRLSKKELLEIMLTQSEEIDKLRAQVAELEAKLDDREFTLSKMGSIAEASLAVTDIFKEAEKAAKIYLDNFRRVVDGKAKGK